jgi:Trk K+ transport system NAD-binding subunit
VLDKADVRSSDVVVAATGDDEDNLVISLLSKQEYGVPHVVARVNHPKNEWLFNETWGVDVPMSPPHVLTALVEEAVTVGDLVRLLKLERGQVTLVEITIDERAPYVGRPLYELRLPQDSAIVAILRPRRDPAARDADLPGRRDSGDRHGRGGGKPPGRADGHPGGLELTPFSGSCPMRSWRRRRRRPLAAWG